MAAMVKVKFRQAYYDGEQYHEKGDIKEFPADTILPTIDIEFLEGKSTANKAKAASGISITKTKKDVAAATRQIQAENNKEALTKE